MSESVMTSTGQKLSLQQVQDIYNDITGRTERLNRFFFDAHNVEISDIENLHNSIGALIEQYNCTASNCSVLVRYIDEKSERFSSFSKFRAQGATRNEYTEEVELKYDFLIVLPKTKEAKPYSLEIGIRSTMSIPAKLEKMQASDIQKSIRYDSMRFTGRLAIDYVDLAVARSIESNIEGWYSELRKQRSGWLQKALKKLEKFVSLAIQTCSLVPACGILIVVLDSRVGDLTSLYRAGIISILCIALTTSASRRLGHYAETQISRLFPLSLVRLTQADAELVSINSHTPAKTLQRVITTSAGAILVGLLTSYLSTFLDL